MDSVKNFSGIKPALAGEIISDGKTISKGRKKQRLIYNSPACHSLLNFAISKHSNDNKRTIIFKVQLDDGEKEVKAKLASVAKRLKISKQEILKHRDEGNLESFINTRIKIREIEITQELAARQNTTWNKPRSNHKVNSLVQKLRVTASDWIWWVGTECKVSRKFSFLLKMSSRAMSLHSKARASREYRRAAKNVPAYKDFLKKNVETKPSFFEDVPITSKDNYIKKNNLNSTLFNGKLPKGGQVDTSTGTTGKPTVWVRSAEERELNRKIISRIRREIIGDAIFINAYALGSLSTGMTVHNALVDENLLSSTGPDCTKVLEMIVALGNSEPGKKIVIAGYPSFMSRLIDKAVEDGINLKDYDLAAIIGGESISEILRDRLTGVNPNSPGGFKKVISSYGASDLDLNIAFETDFSTALRKECLKNPALAKELFGDKAGSPMIFQYNPLFYYIESKNGHLVYTSISGKKISPRIRYDSNDIGFAMTHRELKQKLKNFNVDLPPSSSNLPFLFVWGREGTAATYYAAKVIPEELEQAIQNIPDLTEKVENYALHAYEDEKGVRRMDFWIELKNGVQIDQSNANMTKINEAILNYIREKSIDFKRMDDIAINNQGIRPTLKLFPYGQGPMANQPSHKKKQLIYEGLDCLK